MRNLVAVLRHGTDTEEGERPLSPGEADDIGLMLRPRIVAELGGEVEMSFTSPLRRCVETALASAPGLTPQPLDLLARLPRYADEIKQRAKTENRDSSEIFFEVTGLDAALQRGWDEGGSGIFDFLRSLGARPEKRMLIVAHGGALESVVRHITGRFRAKDVLKKGEGFVIECRDDGVAFRSFLRR